MSLITNQLQANNNAIEFATNTIAGFFVNYPIYQQEKIYYCGPASVKITLHIINKWSESQNTYASRMQTDSSGTFVYQIMNELNRSQTKNSYGWRTINGDESRLWGPVITDLVQHQVPLIARVDTKGLWKYNGKDIGHYVTITGYYGWQTTLIQKELKYADSFYLDYGRGNVFGEHEDTLINFTNATTHLIW